MARQPYIPLYIGDWEQDTNTISLEAEGALIKLTFKLWKANEKGRLSISFFQLSILLKKDIDFTRKIVSELQESGVLNVIYEDGDRVTFESRRMLKIASKSAIYSENGKKGGRPSKKAKKLIESQSVPNRKPLLEYDIENNKELIQKKEREDKRVKTNVLDLIPPDWPKDSFTQVWAEFLEVRRLKKKPLTENAVKRRINELVALSGGSYDLAVKIAQKACDAAWERFFPIKPDSDFGVVQKNGISAGKTIRNDRA